MPNAFLPLTMMSSSIQQANPSPMQQAKPPAPDVDTSSLDFKAVEKVPSASTGQQQQWLQQQLKEIQPLSKEVADEPAPAMGVFAQSLRGAKIPAPSYSQQLQQQRDVQRENK